MNSVVKPKIQRVNNYFVFQIFFVLRKKNNHVSTLHVIHHGCMPMSVWFGVKFTPGMYINIERLLLRCYLTA